MVSYGFVFFLLAALACAAPEVGEVQDCKMSVFGNDYSYPLNVTVSGKTCQRWDSQRPHQHTKTNSSHFPDISLSAAENFCRNPDFTVGGPWCYTTDRYTRWEFCDVSLCPDVAYQDPPEVYGVLDCKLSVFGNDYSYPRSTTRSGKTCQRWDSQTPHRHRDTDITNFPDESLSSAENFCRNPDYDVGGLWCYTTDPATRREHCGVSRCPDVIYEAAESCRFTTQGTEYSGSLDQTASGTICQAWDRQYPHRHEQDLANFTLINPANNYCRNPDSTADGPWCYTVNPRLRWEHCDIPYCNQSLWEQVEEDIYIEGPEDSGEEPDGSGGDEDKVSCWFKLNDQALYGHNDLTVFGVSVDECKRQCMSHTEFVCLSVDYTDDGLCALSRDSAETQPAMMGTHATATYWERVIPCDEEEWEEEGQIDINEELECFPGWNYDPHNQHCYKFEFRDGKNQADARESCLADDAYLVQIEDRDELEYLEAISRQHSDLSLELYWTGGVKINNTWFWEVLDTEGNGEHVPISQGLWEPGEPNNADDIEDKAILAVHPDEDHVGLNDFPGSHRLRYICEKSHNAL